MPDTPVEVLERWEDAGAVWRIESLTDTRAIVQLCTCTGEPVELIESEDPELLEFVRARQAR
jgi:hypothetical protein